MMPLAEVDLRAATWLTGTVMYALAAAACALGAMKVKGAEQRWWVGMAAIAAALLVEMQCNGRFWASGVLSDFARSGHWYADRRPVQALFLVVMGLIWLVAMGIVQWRMRRRDGALRLAVMGCGIALGMLGLEVVSLHQVDEFLNANAGPIMGVGWGWMAGGTMMVGGGLWRGFRGRA